MINIEAIYKFQSGRDPNLLVNATHFIGWLKSRLIKIETNSNEEKFKTISEYQISVIQAAISIVCTGFGILEHGLIGDSRKRDLVDARRVVICACRDAAINAHKPTLELIGSALGGRDHATVAHSYRTKHLITREQMEVYDEAVTVIKDLEIINRKSDNNKTEV